MRMFSKAVMGLSLAATAFLAIPAQALPLLPILNPNFTTISGSSPKNVFSNVAPNSWSQSGSGSNLVFIDGPGTATTTGTGGCCYAVQGPFSNPPVGTNFVQADGDPAFERVFYQQLSGLTIGQTYELTFWQAAGQQTGFTGATTEQWVVSLGKNILTKDASTNPGTYSNADPTASIVKTHLMNTASQGVYNWEQVTINLVADATSEYLSFLAWGNGGSTTNQPPTVFLAGLNSPKLPVPEPMTLSLFSAGLAGLALRRRAKNKAKA